MKLKQSSKKRNTPESRKRRAIPGGVKFYGLYSSVAKRENVSPQFVHQVATGKRTSRRIAQALARAIKKLLANLAEEVA